jgi:hypothetical protein
MSSSSVPPKLAEVLIQVYEQQSAMLKEHAAQLRAALAAEVSENKKPKKSKTENPRSLSAYQVFMKEHLRTYHLKHPELQQKEVLTIIAQRWKGLDPAKKEQYQVEATRLKALPREEESKEPTTASTTTTTTTTSSVPPPKTTEGKKNSNNQNGTNGTSSPPPKAVKKRKHEEEIPLTQVSTPPPSTTTQPTATASDTTAEKKKKKRKKEKKEATTEDD